MEKIGKVPNVEGIYCIQNKVNNKIYIGSSKNLYRRFYQHKAGPKKKQILNCRILAQAYTKYGMKNFTFTVLMVTKDYLLWEEIFLKLLKPEYNIATMNNGKLQPNIRKKFSKEWIDKLGKCTGHSDETKQKLNRLNKQGACKLVFHDKNQILKFESWKEAGVYFNIKSAAQACTHKKVDQNHFKWRNWNITVLKRQKKKVQLTIQNIKYEFSTSYDCDKFLNLWRGATSNAIRNNRGELHGYHVEYL